ncbi:MAG: response regulator [Hyphomonadaceae bacterium]
MPSELAGGSLKLDFRRASALVLDRDLLCIQILVAMLNGFGLRSIARYQEVAQAIDGLNSRTIDIVIMDPTGYGDKGYGLVSWLRSSSAHPNHGATVVLATGYPTVKAISHMKTCTADFLISKPFSTATLFDRLVWVAQQEGKRGQMLAPGNVVSTTGSGVDLW